MIFVRGKFLGIQSREKKNDKGKVIKKYTMGIMEEESMNIKKINMKPEHVGEFKGVEKDSEIDVPVYPNVFNNNIYWNLVSSSDF